MAQRPCSRAITRGRRTWILSLLLLSCVWACDRKAFYEADAALTPLEKQYRSGSDQMFSSVDQVLITPDEGIAVLDRSATRITFLRRDGIVVGTLGRRGSGPGEFEQIGSIGFLSDTLYVSDLQKDAISLFGRNAEFITAIGWASAPIRLDRIAFPATAPQVLTQSGTGLVSPKPGVLFQPEWRLPGVGGLALQVPYLHIDKDGNTTAILWTEANERWFNFEYGGRMLRLSQPFPEHPLVALMIDGTGMVIATRSTVDEAAATVTKLNTSFDTVYHVTLKSPRVPINSALATTLVRLSSISPIDGLGSAADPDVQVVATLAMKAKFFPEVSPGVTQVVPVQDGSVWLRRGLEGRDSTLWTSLLSDGTPGRSTVVPSGEEIVAGRDHLLVTTSHDDLDVPFITVYRFP